MNNSKRLLVPLLTLLVVGCTQQSQNAKQAVIPKEALAAWMDAFNRGDAQALAALYTEDCILMPPNAEMARGHEAVRAIFFDDPSMRGMKATLADEEQQGLGDVAYQRGTYQINDATGQEVDRGKFISIWRKQDGSWKIHRDIWNSNLATAAAQQAQRAVHISARDAKFAEVVPGVSKAQLWGDPEKGPYGAFTRFKPGQMNAAHVHTSDLRIVVLDGAYIYRTDEGEIRVGPRGYFFVPGGTPHTSAGDAKKGALFYEQSLGGFDLKPMAQQ